MSDATALDFYALPLRPASYVASLGPTAVIAPHPDDESLGCGGLLALLARAGLPVWCVLISDGTMSHPNSLRFPAERRQAIREQELQAALAELGVGPQMLLPLGLPDGAVPTPDTLAGAAAVKRLTAFFRRTRPATVLVPWRRDPHPDHHATSLLVRAALAELTQPPRLIEYLVWAWERATPADLPHADEAIGWRLNIESVMGQKTRAIAAHRSQLAPGIFDDDPTGFLLADSMLAHFRQPFEAYIEAHG